MLPAATARSEAASRPGAVRRRDGAAESTTSATSRHSRCTDATSIPAGFWPPLTKGRREGEGSRGWREGAGREEGRGKGGGGGATRGAPRHADEPAALSTRRRARVARARVTTGPSQPVRLGGGGDAPARRRPPAFAKGMQHRRGRDRGEGGKEKKERGRKNRRAPVSLGHATPPPAGQEHNRLPLERGRGSQPLPQAPSLLLPNCRRTCCGAAAGPQPPAHGHVRSASHGHRPSPLTYQYPPHSTHPFPSTQAPQRPPAPPPPFPPSRPPLQTNPPHGTANASPHPWPPPPPPR